MRGWVYIITNESIPDLIKVGFTGKDPKLRAKDLDNEGTPYPYEVEYEIFVNNPKIIERKAHESLKKYHENKEWFRCSVETAIMHIRKVSDEILLEYSKLKLCSIDRFIIKSGVAIDIETNLMWLRFGYGQEWRDDTVTGYPRDVDWKSAFDIAELFNLQGGYCGFTDWRLPSIEELEYLTNTDNRNFNIQEVFPNNSKWYWSSTKFCSEEDDKYYDDGAFIIDFINGYTAWIETYEQECLRFVREC